MAGLEQGPRRESYSSASQEPSLETGAFHPSQEAAKSYVEEEGAERPVLVDGQILGLECETVSLAEFMRTDFPECYLETDSGNIYGLFKQQQGLVIANARSNLGKGNNAQASVVSPEAMSQAVLKVGAPFNFGSGNTSALTRITVVTRSHFATGQVEPEVSRQIAREQTGGRTSDVRRHFRTIIGNTL